MINKIIKNIKNESFLRVSKNYIKIHFWEKIFHHKKRIPDPFKFLNRVTESKDEAVEFLTRRISELKTGKKYSLMISSFDGASDDLEERLRQENISLRIIGIDKLPDIHDLNASEIACVFTSYFDAKTINKTGLFLLNNQKLINIPFEYVCIPKSEYSMLEKFDPYNKFSFVSPLLISDVNFNKIYSTSIPKFNLDTNYFHYTAKCDIRDFMDLNQILDQIVRNQIPGDIAEFGSYKGHSGYLMTEVLKQLGSGKKVYLFDTFEEFPSEEIGIDNFWSNTHKVDFEEVKEKLKTQGNAILVKGDFTKTLPETSIDKLCFAYVDCDSYRATKFLMEYLFENYLSPGGMMVFEDYGHPALLGNRLAIHNFFDSRKDCVRFFSQFSGYYIVIKLF